MERKINPKLDKTMWICSIQLVFDEMKQFGIEPTVDLGFRRINGIPQLRPSDLVFRSNFTYLDELLRNYVVDSV